MLPPNRTSPLPRSDPKAAAALSATGMSPNASTAYSACSHSWGRLPVTTRASPEGCRQPDHQQYGGAGAGCCLAGRSSEDGAHAAFNQRSRSGSSTTRKSTRCTSCANNVAPPDARLVARPAWWSGCPSRAQGDGRPCRNGRRRSGSWRDSDRRRCRDQWVRARPWVSRRRAERGPLGHRGRVPRGHRRALQDGLDACRGEVRGARPRGRG